MRTTGEQHWTWHHFVGWAFGEARLGRLAGHARDAARRAGYLAEVGQDHTVRLQLARHLAAVARDADRLELSAQASVARRLVWMVRTAESRDGVWTQVRDACDGIAQWADARIAAQPEPVPCRSAA